MVYIVMIEVEQSMVQYVEYAMLKLVLYHTFRIKLLETDRDILYNLKPHLFLAAC